MKHPTPDYYPIDPGGFPGVRGVSGFEGLGFQGSAGEVSVSGVSLLTPVLKTRVTGRLVNPHELRSAVHGLPKAWLD